MQWEQGWWRHPPTYPYSPVLSFRTCAGWQSAWHCSLYEQMDGEGIGGRESLKSHSCALLCACSENWLVRRKGICYVNKWAWCSILLTTTHPPCAVQQLGGVVTHRDDSESQFIFGSHSGLPQLHTIPWSGLQQIPAIHCTAIDQILTRFTPVSSPIISSIKVPWWSVGMIHREGYIQEQFYHFLHGQNVILVFCKSIRLIHLFTKRIWELSWVHHSLWANQ